MAPAPDQLAPGSWLGRYQVARLLGRGGMGCVYEAIHRDLGKRVAIKTLLPALAASAESRARFLREGQAAARIRHPHIVDVTDVVADGATTYLVMEYLEGEDLGARLAREGALALRETADVLLPVVAAVAAAHEGGVIHRDLKPENVFLARTAQGGSCPKVVDFGISKVLGDASALALTATSTAFGTIYYLPPEQLRGAREADARSDQYALGAVLYECLTGCRAFDGDGIYGVLKNVAEGNYLAARARRPGLPEAVDAAIARALSLDPAARFPSVRALGAVLLDFASPGAVAQWASVCSAAREPEAPGAAADLRSPSGTMILPAGGETDTVWSEEQAPTADSAVDLRPHRSWTPRLILLGVAIGGVVVALASGRGSDQGAERLAPEEKSIAAEKPAAPEPAAPVTATDPPAPVVAPPAPSSSFNSTPSVVLSPPLHRPRLRHRAHPVPLPHVVTTSAPILE